MKKNETYFLYTIDQSEFLEQQDIFLLNLNPNLLTKEVIAIVIREKSLMEIEI